MGMERRMSPLTEPYRVGSALLVLRTSDSIIQFAEQCNRNAFCSFCALRVSTPECNSCCFELVAESWTTLHICLARPRTYFGSLDVHSGAHVFDDTHDYFQVRISTTPSQLPSGLFI